MNSKPSHESLECRIRELEQSEERLRQAMDLNADIVQIMNDGIVLTDRQGIVTFVNPALEALLGYQSEELIGRPWLDFIPGDQQSPARAADRRRETGQSDRYELALIRKDGAHLSVLVAGTPRFDSRTGQYIGTLGALTDITELRRAEASERRNEERFRLMFMNAPMPYQSLDEQGNFLDVNQAFLDHLGYAREELIGRNFGDLLHPDWVAHFKENFPRFKTVGEVLGGEFEMVKKDGSTVLVFFKGRIQRGDDDRFLRTHCIFQDITDRKKAEETLRYNETRHAKLIANIGDVIAIIDQDGIIRYKSPNIERDFGWKPEEVVGVSAWENVHPADAEAAKAFIGALLEKPNSVATAECRYRCRDGSYKWIEFTGVNLLHDPDIQGVLGNYQDISERKRVEDALKKSEEVFRLTFYTSPDSININRLEDGMYVDVNQGFLQLTGYTREDVIGRTSLELNIWHKPDDRHELVRGLKEKGYYSNLSADFRIKDGTLRSCLMSARIIMLDNVPHIITITRDITELKRAEEEREKLREQLVQAQKMESVGRLAGGVAHDFNNMLTVILGHVELLLDRIVPERAMRADLEAIRKAAMSSADLTRQLLAFARRQTIAPKVIDLNETVEGMLKMLRRLIGEDIDLAWQPNSGLYPIKVDATQIDQILANLALNARDAIDGVGKIAIETDNATFDAAYCADHPGSVPGAYVMLALSDDGAGMEKEIMAHLFEPFYTTKPVGQGTGLGLATVYGIVKQNDGFLSVHSSPGQGTTFKLYFPRHAGDEGSSERNGGRDFAKGGHETVLLVEDEPSILELGQAMLERLGYDVLAADSPGEAIRLAEAHPGAIHLLMTDVVMPEMNGRDLARRLQSVRSGLKCLFMSGYTANVIAHHGVLDQGVHFIQKPFTGQGLAEKVRMALDS